MLGSKVHKQSRWRLISLVALTGIATYLTSAAPVAHGGALGSPSPHGLIGSAMAQTRPLARALGTDQKTQAAPRPKPVGPTPQVRALQQAVAQFESWTKGRGGTLSAEVVDTQSGAVLAQANPQTALNPASNMKLLTVAVALSTLGGEHQFSTGVYGTLSDGRVETLVLRGEGDPSLDLAGLWRLAHALERLGVREVGQLLVDQSRFDDQFVPPAYEQQPDEWARFRAPVSAVAINQNSVTLNVVPTEPGKPARVWFEPAGIVTVRGSVTTRKRGRGQAVRLTLHEAANEPTEAEGSKKEPRKPFPAADASSRLTADIGGHVSEGMPRLRFARRLSDPRRAPGLALERLLDREGIIVHGGVGLGGQDETHRLAFHRSRPLARLVHPLGKQSDNFYAEMLLKTLGAASGKSPATSADGAAAIQRWLDDRGAWAADTAISNGSGLFDANRVSARTLTQTLAAVARDTRIFPEFVAQLSIGGVDGTLRSRLRKLRGTRRIRAKTGTLNSAVSLSGYILSDTGQAPLAFSLMVNGLPGQAYLVRQRFDQVVELALQAMGDSGQ